MPSLLAVLVLSACLCVSQCGRYRTPFKRAFPVHPTLHGDPLPGDPLYLTPYIEQGKAAEARQKSAVTLDVQGRKVPAGHAGFFTVNKEHKSNLFFWFFPKQHDPEGAPLLLWLQGGPGGSSMFGLFNEHGPFAIASNLSLVMRDESWGNNHHLLYIDNPVGTGFSFTENDAGYARNEADVARDLHEAMRQFFIVFDAQAKADFYVTGESYAGKYVPALVHEIHRRNEDPKARKINLKGMAIGDGFSDPYSMTNYGDYLYQIGMIGRKELAHFDEVEQMARKLIQLKEWKKAFQVFDALLDGDKIDGPSYFTNVTGSTYYFNFLQMSEPPEFGYYPKYLNRGEVRAAIHVGDRPFNNGSAVEDFLLEDIMQSAKPDVEAILDAGYKVLLYGGQLDIIVAYPLTVNFVASLEWKHAAEFAGAARRPWRVGEEVAGYVQEWGNLKLVMVRGAGHMVPYDQPKWAFDMISRFTGGKPFARS